MDSNPKNVSENDYFRNLLKGDKNCLSMLADINGEISDELLNQILEKYSAFPFFSRILQISTNLKQEEELLNNKYHDILELFYSISNESNIQNGTQATNLVSCSSKNINFNISSIGNYIVSHNLDKIKELLERGESIHSLYRGQEFEQIIKEHKDDKIIILLKEAGIENITVKMEGSINEERLTLLLESGINVEFEGILIEEYANYLNKWISEGKTNLIKYVLRTNQKIILFHAAISVLYSYVMKKEFDKAEKLVNVLDDQETWIKYYNILRSGDIHKAIDFLVMKNFINVGNTTFFGRPLTTEEVGSFDPENGGQIIETGNFTTNHRGGRNFAINWYTYGVILPFIIKQKKFEITASLLDSDDYSSLKSKQNIPFTDFLLTTMIYDKESVKYLAKMYANTENEIAKVFIERAKICKEFNNELVNYLNDENVDILCQRDMISPTLISIAYNNGKPDIGKIIIEELKYDYRELNEELYHIIVNDDSSTVLNYPASHVSKQITSNPINEESIKLLEALLSRPWGKGYTDKIFRTIDVKGIEEIICKAVRYSAYRTAKYALDVCIKKDLDFYPLMNEQAARSMKMLQVFVDFKIDISKSFYKAIREGNLELADFIYNNNQFNMDMSKAFYYACKGGFFSIVKQISSNYLINPCIVYGKKTMKNSLIAAGINQHYSISNFIFQNYPEVILEAAENLRPEMVKIIFLGNDYETVSKFIITGMSEYEFNLAFECCCQNKPNSLRALFDFTPFPISKIKNVKIMKGDEVLELIAKHNIIIKNLTYNITESLSIRGLRMLKDASFIGESSVKNAINEKKFDLAKRIDFGTVYMELVPTSAQKVGDVLAKVIIKEGADSSSFLKVCDNGYSPYESTLNLAVRCIRKDILQCIFERNKDITISNDLMCDALESSTPAVIDVLIEHGGKWNFHPPRKDMPSLEFNYSYFITTVKERPHTIDFASRNMLINFLAKDTKCIKDAIDILKITKGSTPQEPITLSFSSEFFDALRNEILAGMRLDGEYAKIVDIDMAILLRDAGATLICSKFVSEVHVQVPNQKMFYKRSNFFGESCLNLTKMVQSELFNLLDPNHLLLGR